MTDSRYRNNNHLFPLETVLRDGTPILVRPIHREDAKLLQIGMEHLSAEAKYFRFSGALPKIPPKLLRQLTEIDHINHEAIGALDVSQLDPDPIGIARYIRLSAGKLTAEVAVTVVDAHQKKGLGTLLLAILAHSAIANGIHEFTAIVLAANSSMRRIFRELGAVENHEDEQQINVRIPLFQDAGNYPPTAVGDAFRHIAALIETNCERKAE